MQTRTQLWWRLGVVTLALAGAARELIDKSSIANQFIGLIPLILFVFAIIFFLIAWIPEYRSKATPIHVLRSNIFIDKDNVTIP